MSFEINLKKQIDNKIFTVLVFLFLPLVSCFFFCLIQGMTLGDIFLPASQFNDEIMYYKQIEGAIAYGYPQGYFGYNESNAAVLTFSSWSPVIIYPYIFMGKILGFGYSSLFVINILFLSVAFAVFAALYKPTWKETIIIYGIFAVFIPLTRLELSAMSDIEIIALCVAYTGIYLSSERNSENGEAVSWGAIVAMFVLAVLLSLMRPYFLLLFFFPGLYAFRKKKSSLAVTLLLILATAGVYAVISSKFTAAYFFPLIKTDWIKEILASPLHGIREALVILFYGGLTVLSYFGPGLTGGRMEQTLWILYVIVGIYVLVMSFKDKKYRPWLVMLILFSCAVIMFYDIPIGSRHLMPFLVMIFLLSATGNRINRISSVVVMVLMIVLFTVRIGQDTYNYVLPEYDNELSTDIVMLSSECDGMVSDSDSYWDNTMIWVWYDGATVHWNEFYALPAGIGINMCKIDYVTENFGNLKSKYIASTPDGEVAKLCGENKLKMIASTDDLCIWELR